MASRTDALPRRFARIYTGAITDVMDEMGLTRQTLPSALQPLTPAMRLAGYAFTARGRPHRGNPRERDATLRQRRQGWKSDQPQTGNRYRTL